MTCIIVDDEPLARQGIATYVAQIESLVLLNSFENAIEAIEFIKNNHVDLLLLDVQMQEMSGIEMLQQLQQNPITILITANAQYAIEAYNLDVIDYLVKPVLFNRFNKAIEKASDFFAYSTKEKPIQYMFIKVNKVLKKIYFEEILYIEALSNYINICTKTEKNIVYQSVKYFEEVIPKHFCRIHKSYIVNLNEVTAYTRFDVVINSNKLPIGRKYLNAFKKSIDP